MRERESEREREREKEREWEWERKRERKGLKLGVKRLGIFKHILCCIEIGRF